MAEYYSIYKCTTSSLSTALLLDTWLLPRLGYCKECCCEYWGAYAFLNQSFLWICAREWDCWITGPPSFLLDFAV